MMTVNAGEKLKMPCSFEHDARNRVTNIKWEKDGGGDVFGGGGGGGGQGDDDTRVDFGADGSITIQQVHRRHEGNYRYVRGQQNTVLNVFLNK